jgi:hypothetical protein
MPGMIESHVEAAQSRKGLQLPAWRIRVTNAAHRAAGVCELRRVTTGARRMTILPRPRRQRRVRFATMTEQAWQSRMIGIRVLELRVVGGLS